MTSILEQGRPFIPSAPEKNLLQYCAGISAPSLKTDGPPKEVRPDDLSGFAELEEIFPHIYNRVAFIVDFLVHAAQTGFKDLNNDQKLTYGHILGTDKQDQQRRKIFARLEQSFLEDKKFDFHDINKLVFWCLRGLAKENSIHPGVISELLRSIESGINSESNWTELLLDSSSYEEYAPLVEQIQVLSEKTQQEQFQAEFLQNPDKIIRTVASTVQTLLKAKTPDGFQRASQNFEQTIELVRAVAVPALLNEIKNGKSVSLLGISPHGASQFSSASEYGAFTNLVVDLSTLNGLKDEQRKLTNLQIQRYYATLVQSKDRITDENKFAKRVFTLIYSIIIYECQRISSR